MSGFVALYREAFAHPVLKDADRFRAWFWLVAHAAWKQTRHDARGRTIEVRRGQICAGREHLAREWKWSPSAVERFLTRLETEQMIERETGQGKSVITIRNYDKYQVPDREAGHMSGQEAGQKSDRNRTAKEQGNNGITTSAKADDGQAVPTKDLWVFAVAYLGEKRRSLIGRWVKQFGEEPTAKAITAAQVIGAVDPVSYITAALKKRAAEDDEVRMSSPC